MRQFAQRRRLWLSRSLVDIRVDPRPGQLRLSLLATLTLLPDSPTRLSSLIPFHHSLTYLPSLAPLQLNLTTLLANNLTTLPPNLPLPFTLNNIPLLLHLPPQLPQHLPQPNNIKNPRHRHSLQAPPDPPPPPQQPRHNPPQLRQHHPRRRRRDNHRPRRLITHYQACDRL